ncbi:MAG: bifunctional 2-polyprenyl-6-hydroxyphenol methylase/3-demethylubiquinol 3-O-methyltransferase UbiG [Gammaproteobacteria bacterium]|nr:MAG: bifunctional 2-polyprenyl-6-hydroxyphenol methylase/3-demethylubiquinol 3-O-methyltransferase UbiG [Gammaproteobacteria bacterium]
MTTSTNSTPNNIDTGEVGKFDSMAARWWDTEGEFRPLHDLNPTRLFFIKQHAELSGKRVLDVGCGGGILTESLAREGAHASGIDAAEKALKVAKLHAMESGLKIDYQLMTAEEKAAQAPSEYDVVTCLEILEHVPDPSSLISACAQLVKPGGKVFFSTINRNAKAYALAVLGAEYVMRLLPKGTHDYQKFIKPSELAQWARDAGLSLVEQAGMHYNPVLRSSDLIRSVDVNYLACFERPANDE